MTAPSVTVYTRPACYPCDATKNQLTKFAIPFTEVPIADAPEIAATAREAGWSSAPIVFADTDHTGPLMWGGYRPDRIARLVAPCE